MWLYPTQFPHANFLDISKKGKFIVNGVANTCGAARMKKTAKK